MEKNVSFKFNPWTLHKFIIHNTNIHSLYRYTDAIDFYCYNYISSFNISSCLADDPLPGPGIAKGGDVWALVIKAVKASDAGLYMCELNTEPPVRSFHRLTG